jgi:hypothetical protein
MRGRVWKTQQWGGGEGDLDDGRATPSSIHPTAPSLCLRNDNQPQPQTQSRHLASYPSILLIKRRKGSGEEANEQADAGPALSKLQGVEGDGFFGLRASAWYPQPTPSQALMAPAMPTSTATRGHDYAPTDINGLPHALLQSSKQRRHSAQGIQVVRGVRNCRERLFGWAGVF